MRSISRFASTSTKHRPHKFSFPCTNLLLELSDAFGLIFAVCFVSVTLGLFPLVVGIFPLLSSVSFEKKLRSSSRHSTEQHSGEEFSEDNVCIESRLSSNNGSGWYRAGKWEWEDFSLSSLLIDILSWDFARHATLEDVFIRWLLSDWSEICVPVLRNA